MVTTEQQAPGRATIAQRWLARLALVAAAAAVLVPLAAAGFRQSLALVLVGVVGLGRAALGRDPGPGKMRDYDAPPPRRPYLIMNPRSPMMDWKRLRRMALTGPGTGHE